MANPHLDLGQGSGISHHAADGGVRLTAGDGGLISLRSRASDGTIAASLILGNDGSIALSPLSGGAFAISGRQTISDTTAFTTNAQNGGGLFITHTSTSTNSGGTFGSVGTIANGDYGLGVLVEYNPASASSNLLFGILSQVNVSGSSANSGFLDNAWHGLNYNSTGNFTTGGIWVGEFSGANMNSATVTNLTACEFNVQNGCDATFKSPGGAGIITNGYAVRTVLAPYGSAATGFTNGYHFYAEGSDSVNDAQFITNRWGGIIKAQNNTPTGTSTTGGFISRGWEIRLGAQGGNTDGLTNENTGLFVNTGGGAAGSNSTINNKGVSVAITGGTSTGGTSVANNWAFFADRIQVACAFIAGFETKRHGSASAALPGSTIYGFHAEIPVAGGNATSTVNNIGVSATTVGTAGTSGNGGAVNNIGAGFDVPAGAAGTGGSVVANYALKLAGNGGTATNWALYSSSTAASSLLGPLSIGTNSAPTASSLMMAAGWDILPGGGTTSMVAGFNYVPAGAGAPTGVPTNDAADRAAVYYDKTNHFLYVYDSGWKKSTVYA